MDKNVRSEMLNTTNPLFNDRALKLGTFCSNLSGGCTISTMDGVLGASWADSTALAKMADEMEFEAIVPVGRWRGFGGQTDFNGSGFECFTFAAGVAAQTKYSALFATSHVPSIHPVMAAKQATTVDHISSGRFALNLVTGWHKTEIEIFGAPLLEHGKRYECAAEWLEIIKQLWQRDEPYSHDGQYFKVDQALLKPRPIQSPYPPVMCAGASTAGRHFAAKYCDVAFAALENRENLESLQATVRQFKDLARKEYGRELKVWSHAYIFQGETERDARSMYNYCVHEKGDWVAVENLITTMGINSQTFTSEGLQKLKADFIAGWGGYPLVGTKDQIVDGLMMLNKAGLDGVLLTWPKYVEGMKQFQEETMKLVIQTGLR
jgi:alkanesulfonate monooxygenase SsuD/methylene tetrahydromethanopterin reductase-like flavin-dependent oxidoreductase (luciferase family)